MIDQTINGRYQIEALLGRGGMGSVYRAIDLVQNRVVALKFLDLYRGEQTEMALTRFQREFRVLTRLNHPRIIQAYEFGTYDGTPYLVLEFLDGTTLTNEIATGPLPRARSLLIASQICDPLAYLHTQAIVHRDLKPDNLMLMPADGDLAESGIKLMDFGLVHQADLSLQLTQDGLVLGTVAYMAPEQAQGFPVDFRADLYALGAILYQMVTGQPPFTPDSPVVMLMQLLTSVPPAPHQINPQVDEPLAQLIMHLLAKEPSERPPNVEAVATRLAQLADETVPTLSLATAMAPGPHRIDLIPRVPLIGREAVLTQLLEYWAKSRSGQGQVVLLSGVAGVGKTRLLDEAKVRIQMEQGWIVRSHCQDQVALPYQPIINILDALLHQLPPTVKESLPPELTRLLPNADNDSFGDLDNSDQAVARRRLFTACWEVIRQATQKQALQIIIEDLQWIDSATQELLDYLLEQVGQARLLLVLTYRPEEFDPTTSLAALRRDLGHQQVAHTIKLKLLTHAQAARFLQSVLGWKEVPAWLIDNFYQATNGNPLFIEETLKALAAEGQVAEWIRQGSSQSRTVNLSGVGLQLPQNVLDLARRRLQLLTDEDRAILTTAAVLGPEFPFALLEAVTKLDEDDLLDAVDRLLADRLIEELPLQAGEDRYRFAQEALRQALLTTISQRRLRTLHRRAGEAIQTLYDANQRRHWPVLAHHFSGAGDGQQAFKYFILAGNANAQVYANAEAIAYYRRALEIVQQGEANETSEELTQLYIRLGRTLELNSQYEPALATYEAMAKLAQQQGDAPMTLASLLARITLYGTYTPVHDPAQAEILADEALTLARALGDQAAEVKILWNLVTVYGFSDRVPEAIALGERALALARPLNLREQMAFILTDVGRFCMMSGLFERAKVLLDEAENLWRELDNLPLLADSLSAAAHIYVCVAEHDQALAASEEAFQINHAIDNLWGQAHSRYRIGYTYWDHGQVEQAITVMEEAIRLSELAGFMAPQVITRADLAAVYAGLGAIERGLEMVHLALSVAETRISSSSAYILAMLAQVYLQQGNLTEAEGAVNQAKNSSRQGTFPIFFIPVKLAEGELRLRQGNYEKAMAVTDDLLATLREFGMRIFMPQALYLQARTLLALGQAELGRERLLEAQTEAKAIGSRRMLWQILATLAQIASDPTKAAHFHQQSREIVKYIADHTPTDLRDSFLALPEVRAIK
ncbi:MAG: hypothetical protein AMJ56_19275 [Anaerolineae bacterium SG8_19]|nr:MAG: hypothetical protein AMJ56_19275 [Anaerolineae bacterium SG8_19]